MKCFRPASWLLVVMVLFICGAHFGILCLAADASDLDTRIKEIAKSSKKATTNTELNRACVDVFEVIDSAIAADDYVTAGRACTLAADLATKSGSKHLLYRAKSRKDDVQALTKEFKSISKSLKKLESAADDPDSNRKVGLFVAALHGDWKRGAEMLGKAGDPLLNKISTGELADPQSAAEQTTLAAAWKEVSDNEPPAFKLRMQKRAYYWDQRAYRAAEGAAKQRLSDVLDDYPFRYLSDMDELDVGAGILPFSKYGTIGRAGVEPTPISLDGFRYELGLGMHPAGGSKPFTVKFKLNGKYKTFQTGCGLNDSSDGYGSELNFSVFGDGRLIWKSSPVKTKNDAEFVTVNVKGIQTLELRTDSGSSRNAHAVWFDPYVAK